MEHAWVLMLFDNKLKYTDLCVCTIIIEEIWKLICEIILGHILHLSDRGMEKAA
jgi:hypothetical protein